MNNQRLKYIDLGAGIMITSIGMYHVLMWKWVFEDTSSSIAVDAHITSVINESNKR